MMQLAWYAGHAGIPFSEHYEPSSAVQIARQTLIDAALEDAAVTHVLFVDDDMIFSVNDFINLWTEFNAHDLDFLSALAFRNSNPTCPCIFGKVPGVPRWGDKEWWHILSDYPGLPRRRFNSETQQYDLVTPNGPHGRFKVEASGFGMVLLSRRMLDKMRRDKDGNIIPGYRHFVCAKGHSPNEDVAFCLNAIDKGFDIWCDSRVSILHESKDRPLIGEREYINQGDRIEQCSTPIPLRMKLQAADTTECTALSSMEKLYSLPPPQQVEALDHIGCWTEGKDVPNSATLIVELPVAAQG